MSFFFSSSRRLTPGVLHFSSSSSEWDERTASLSLARFHNSRRRYTRSISLSLHYVRRCSPLQQARRLLGERPLGGEALDFRSVDSFSVVDVVIVVVVVASSSPPWLSFARFLPRGRSRSHAAGRALHPGPAHGRVCDPSRSGSPRSGSRSGRWRRRPPPAEGPARFALAADGRQDCLLGHAGEVPFFFESCYLPRDAEKQRRRKTGRNREKKKRKSRLEVFFLSIFFRRPQPFLFIKTHNPNSHFFYSHHLQTQPPHQKKQKQKTRSSSLPSPSSSAPN